MGSVVVVAMQPIGSHVTHFSQAVEDVAAERLRLVGLIESFQVGILRGFGRLDVLQGNALALRPLRQCVGEALGTVV